jgi:FkbM family methyltransferase
LWLFAVFVAVSGLDSFFVAGVHYAAMSAKLTVIIPCKDERENIAACIASAQQVADEVLLADSGSTDGTLEIARHFSCRIISRAYGTSGDFKNWAIPQAEHDWVFVLDADERITPHLATEIRRTLEEPRHDGYWVYRLNHFMGQSVRHGPWRNDSCLRLFRRESGRYAGATDHAEVKLSSGTAGRLRERLIHYTCTSYAQYLPKLSRYADVQARIWQEHGRRPSLLQLLFRFPIRFFQGYVLRLGFLDGLAGLQVCALVAYLSWLKQAYLWQMQSGKDGRELDNGAYLITPTAPGSAGGTGRDESVGRYETPGGAGGCQSTASDSETVAQSTKNRTFREWRRRITPKWLKTDVRRQRRNVFLRRLGYQRCFTPPIIIRDPSLLVRSSLRYVVANELLINPRLTFLQIGAFDGVGDDDLRELVTTHKLRGVLVEPQPAAFARLQQNYRNEHQVTLLQAAIAETEGMRDLYCHRSHASMAASFDRNHLRKHGIADCDIIIQQVPCHTVESALRTAALDNVDLIQIDAEGYDWPIIRSVDLKRIRPRIMRFEYRHMSDEDADACLAHLASHGYRFVIESKDIIAIRVEESVVQAVVPKRRSA